MDSGEMPRDGDDRGDDLRALFEREPLDPAEQPFVSEMAWRIAAARRRRTFLARAIQVVAVGALLAASPLLVSASALLSTSLDALFSSAAKALDSPYGYGAGLVCFAAAAAVFRRRLRYLGF